MEDLTKTQLTLLTLLVSFVTSIATGIITVSLLQEAPPEVTQTINRVVEKTIERVVPEDMGGGKVKEVTVVVKEEDLVIDAINKNVKSIVRIQDTAPLNGVAPFYGIGFVVSKEGIVVSSRKENISAITTYQGTLSNGTVVQMKVLEIDEAAGVAFFQVIKDDKNPVTLEPAIFATKALQLGQSVIALEGETQNVVSIGRVVSFDYAGKANTTAPQGIGTDIRPKTGVYGGPLVNLNGEIVGLRTSNRSPGEAGENYTSLDLLKAAMAAKLK